MRIKRTPGHRKRMAYLRARLLERRKELHRVLHRELSVPVAGLPVHPGDSSDAAADSSARETAGYLAELEALELGQIDEALSKIRKGTYGICEECGDRIGAARLRAVPFASLCLRCKENEERLRAARSKPVRWRGAWDEGSDVYSAAALHGALRGRRVG